MYITTFNTHRKHYINLHSMFIFHIPTHMSNLLLTVSYVRFPEHLYNIITNRMNYARNSINLCFFLKLAQLLNVQLTRNHMRPSRQRKIKGYIHISFFLITV